MKKLITVGLLLVVGFSAFAKTWSYTYFDQGIRCEVSAYKNNSKSRNMLDAFGKGLTHAGANMSGNQVNNNGLISQWAKDSANEDMFFFIDMENKLNGTEVKQSFSIPLNKLTEGCRPFNNDKKMAKLIDKAEALYISMYRAGESKPYCVIEHKMFGNGKDVQVEVVQHVR